MNKTIDQLIASGDTKQALEQLGDFLKDLSGKYQDEWFQLSGRFYKLENEQKLGVLSESEKEVGSNKINFDILKLFNDCREVVYKYVPTLHLSGTIDQNIEELLQHKLMGKYKVLKKVGEGTTGLIFKAKDEFSGRVVAIKVLKVRTTELEQAREEVEKVTRFKHRGIIKIFDVYFDRFPHCIITEFIDGINLDKLIQGSGAIPLARTQQLICQLGDILDYIRHRKVWHTTIRPSKIQIDEEGHAVLSPFEVIKSGRPDRNLEKILQDCAYLSPEKLAPVKSNHEFDTSAEERSDQFSIAVLMYEMLTGKRLFEGENIPNIIHARDRFFENQRDRQAKMAAINHYPAMKRVLSKMLQKAPENRYEDLKSALRAIEAVEIQEKPVLLKVKDSYQRCLMSGEDFMADFYDNFFEKLPEAKKMFREDRSHQHRMLQNAILLLLEPEGSHASLEHILQSPKHHGLKAQDYEVFIAELIHTVSEHDEKWSKELHKAWQQATEPALKILKAAT